MAYRAPSVPTARLERDAKADVLVVGLGISGAMIAESLTDAGMSVIGIDRRGPNKGSTAATTALVSHEIDQPLTALAGQIGKDAAISAWRRSRLAVANLSSRIDALGIACGKAERPSLLLAGNRLDPAGLREEAEARRAAGLACEYLTAGQLRERFGIDRKGAILSPGNLALDPRKLTAGLLNAAAARGARFHAPAEAVRFEISRDAVTVETVQGPTIEAKAVVLATGYELTDIVPRDGHEVISTWAIATAPQKSKLWPQEAFIWEASDPYLYMRTLPDGRVVCGGEDEDFTDEERRDELIGEKSRTISAKLGKVLPNLDTKPEFAWAGSFGTTPTGLPIIGQVPRKPRIFATLGYGGNGITWSRIAAELITTTLCGGTDTDAKLFAFKD